MWNLRTDRAREYYVESGEIESERFAVEVLDRPSIKKLSVAVEIALVSLHEYLHDQERHG